MISQRLLPQRKVKIYHKKYRGNPYRKGRGYLVLLFSGDGFLFHMVRILMGTLLLAGTGEIEPEEVKRILRSGKRENAGPLVPALGLSLIEVRYS